MSRLARVVVPGIPHHVTQRGGRKQQTFFNSDDYRRYLVILAERLGDVDIEVWAYCLMPNHVHFVVVPSRSEALAKLLQYVHQKYAREINMREGWQGHLWQQRFFSVPMDETYLVAAVRYVELNPVRAGLCAHPRDWPWSSVHAHEQGTDDGVVTVAPMLERVSKWQQYLTETDSKVDVESIRKKTSTGRPLGSSDFINRLESMTGRRLRKRKPGPPPADK